MACWHQTVNWTNIDLSSLAFYGMHPRTFSQVPKLLFCIMSLKTNHALKIKSLFLFCWHNWTKILAYILLLEIGILIQHKRNTGPQSTSVSCHHSAHSIQLAPKVPRQSNSKKTEARILICLPTMCLILSSGIPRRASPAAGKPKINEVIIGWWTFQFVILWQLSHRE